MVANTRIRPKSIDQMDGCDIYTQGVVFVTLEKAPKMVSPSGTEILWIKYILDNLNRRTKTQNLTRRTFEVTCLCFFHIVRAL
jgi:hypothetical protein